MKASNCASVSRKPVSQRETRGNCVLAFALHGDEVAHVGHDAVEHIFAAHHLEDRRLCRIERNPQFIEAGVDQGLPIGFRQQRAVGIEEHIDPALFQITDHARQLLHQHRLAHAVQHHAGNFGVLVDDAGKQLPRHVLLGLELFKGARAGGAQQVAAIGGFQIEADRIRFHDYRELVFRLLKVTPHVLLR